MHAWYTPSVPDGPSEIGPLIDFAVKKAGHLKRYMDEVSDLRERARRVWEEMLGHEVRVMVMDGMPPRNAEQAARNNLAIRKADLDKELEGAIERERDTFHRRIRRLLEELDDELGVSDPDTAGPG